MRSGKTQAGVDAFVQWLDGVQLTKPVTLDDTKALYGMIKSALVGFGEREINAHVACNDGENVEVRVEIFDGIIAERTLRAV